jgi:hypothetical protein
MTNCLLAKTIPADLETAQDAFSAVAGCSLPEGTEATLSKVLVALKEGGNDWRKTVLRIEWVLSRTNSYSLRSALVKTVRALGYVALAAVWLGEAAKGKAVCFPRGSRVFLVGPNNKAGRTALKKIFSRRFHPASDALYTDAKGKAKAAWSIKATEENVAKFKLVVTTHWPNHDSAELEVACAIAAGAAASEPTEKVEPAGPATSVTDKGDGWLAVATPFNWEFVNAVKALPYKARKWNKAAKVWEVTTEYKAAVEEIIAKVYGAKAA